ncbi:MAG: ribosome small subunit-dependent GTPase A [Bdellovibrionaceae bacterium]|nr:ribosome small subunit-dependent GTPase A [Pseudobdellovibrionaceae bacterium]
MTSNSFLVSLGWDESFQKSWNELQQPGLFPGRIMSQGKGHYHVLIAPEISVEAAITSQLRNAAKSAVDFPGVGDWVILSAASGTQKANIHSILNRKSVVQRKRGGTSQEVQLLVTNVDFIFVVTSLNEDFDMQRLASYREIGEQSGGKTVFILTKTDICEDPDKYVHQLQSQFGNIDIYKISSNDNNSIDKLQKYFAPGITTVLLGSSGVGKSTLTNYLLGLELQKTQGLSGESRGRHTTTSRNILYTRWGGLVIDTPGMQEVSTFEANVPAPTTFADIEELMLKCKFTNCRHGNDPGCAISSSIKKGTLSADRWSLFIKINS